MKKITIIIAAIVVFASGCATVQSVIKSTFPYTASLIVPASAPLNSTQSATSVASSIDQVFGNQNGADYVREVRVGSARIDANNPSSQNLGIFKSIKLFISNGSGEVMIASRNDISENIGNNLVLDIDNTRFIDEYIKSGTLKVRMEYVLRNNSGVDLSVRAAINFNTSPKNN